MEKIENKTINENMNWEEARSVVAGSILILDNIMNFLDHNYFVGEFDDENFNDKEVKTLNSFYLKLAKAKDSHFFKLSGIIEKIMKDEKFKEYETEIIEVKESVTEIQGIIYNITENDIKLDSTFKKLLGFNKISNDETDNYNFVKVDASLFKKKLPMLITKLKKILKIING